MYSLRGAIRIFSTLVMPSSLNGEPDLTLTRPKFPVTAPSVRSLGDIFERFVLDKSHLGFVHGINILHSEAQWGV